LDDPRPHSERLLPALDRLLERAGVASDAIGLVAVSIGPGSFTGLRVGLATVKGLCLGAERPVAPVPTLAALAHAAVDAPGPVAALLDARRGEVYAAVYADAADPGEPTLTESVYRPEALGRALPEGCTVVAGEGALEAARKACAAAPGARLWREAEIPLDARPVGRLGVRRWRRGGAASAAALVPRYLRRAEAEARRTGEPLEGAPGRFDTAERLP
jgi:tRNA threonylcarbamoyladenosine biosynthesis protein TsaB